MSAEAEATDILVKVSLESAEFFLRIGGTLASKGLAAVFALIKTLYEKEKGNQKLGGRINARAFMNSVSASEIIPLTKSDLDKLKPELKRLHIRYMQLKSTKDMKSDGKVDIVINRNDADLFVRLAENFGIAAVKPYDVRVNEITPEEYESALAQSTAKGLDISVSDDGITVNERSNPSEAPTVRSPRSEQNSVVSDPTEMDFNPNKSIDDNLKEAFIVSERRNGNLIPISANKETLFVSETDDFVTVIVPGTRKSERLVIPRDDIVSMQADNGQTIRADLKKLRSYDIVDKSGNLKRKVTGDEIRASNNWNVKQKPIVKAPKTPTLTKGVSK